MNATYSEFLATKRHRPDRSGFEPRSLLASLYPFQRTLTEWAVRGGRRAVFADTGLGKTAIELAWCQEIVEHTAGRALILAPLAVTRQTIAEARKFGIEAKRLDLGGPAGSGVYVTNYERLHHARPEDYAGVACDESSVLKSFEGARRKEITTFLRSVRYRLLCSATPAPNDVVEFGTSSEALGHLGQRDMLDQFFRSTDAKQQRAKYHADRTRWSFRPHAEEPFWMWLASWARAIRRPSDAGGDDRPFRLPPLELRETVVRAAAPLPGELFRRPAETWDEERRERRLTLRERCEKVAELLSHDRPALAWCHLNEEGNLLERLIPGARQVAGATPDDEKEELLDAFSRGELRVLVTKPKIGGWGLNWQHCAHMAMFPSHSFESYYQCVRRCWRYGQRSPVVVDLVASEGESRVRANLERKAVSAEAAYDRLVALVHEAEDPATTGGSGDGFPLPQWLRSEVVQ